MKSIEAPRHRHDRRRICQIAGPGIARQAPRHRQGTARQEHTAMCAPEAQARAARRARRVHKFDAAAEPGRGGVQPTSGDRRGRSQAQGAPSRTRAPPRRRPARNTAPSPSGGCGSAWCWPRSASKNSITVTDDEMNRARGRAGPPVPGREQEIWDYYRNNPDALASLRAPIFEEKVVDFLARACPGHRKEGLARGTVSRTTNEKAAG